MKDNEKTKIHIPLKKLSSSKYLLPLANLILICIVIILFAISGVFYFSSPVKDISKVAGSIELQENEDGYNKGIFSGVDKALGQIKTNDDYSVISNRNIFSSERKEWVTNASILKTISVVKREIKKKNTPSRQPRKIILYGVILAGDIKKALINNPRMGAGRKRTLYVVEGEDVEGYKVKSIESDHIKLDWQGEEIIVKLYIN